MVFDTEAPIPSIQSNNRYKARTIFDLPQYEVIEECALDMQLKGIDSTVVMQYWEDAARSLEKQLDTYHWSLIDICTADGYKFWAICSQCYGSIKTQDIDMPELCPICGAKMCKQIQFFTFPKILPDREISVVKLYDPIPYLKEKAIRAGIIEERNNDV